jgi:hypothetical protein
MGSPAYGRYSTAAAAAHSLPPTHVPRRAYRGVALPAPGDGVDAFFFAAWRAFVASGRARGCPPSTYEALEHFLREGGPSRVGRRPDHLRSGVWVQDARQLLTFRLEP